MLRFYADRYVRISGTLGVVERMFQEGQATAIYKKSESSVSAFNRILVECQTTGLDSCAAQVQRIIQALDKGSTYSAMLILISALRDRLIDELAATYLLHLPRHKVEYFADTPQFGEAVADKFPKAAYDIQEAAKCLATARSTGCVFHLMRCLELATQQLGKRLGINLVHEKNWHNILDEVDKAIKKLPIASSRQKKTRNRFAEASAHLRMVKDAWRNEVMHPKETYTEEEAERIFRNVKDFMVHLATKL